jgi:DNA (cytosine-5)-methyltransferase 1
MKNDDNNTKTITHLSLCSGYEGIGLGLRRVLPNLREIAYVEREGFPVANLVAKMEAGDLDAAPVFTDVKTVPYRKFRGLVDILSGGFPCQPFSTAGKREGVEDPRHLFPYIRDGIRECRPRLVFLENVEGIISSKTEDGDSVLQYVLGELEGMGYRATAGVFSASEVGATHQRKRVFILGIMANHSSTRSETWIPTERHWEKGDAKITNNYCLGDWPSRPGERQKVFEEPRTVKSKLGRTTNGSSSRVDRLRLLGNGVVPATAAKAFVTLLNRITL